MTSDRLSALDSSFLHIEDESPHVDVAMVMLFDGDPPMSKWTRPPGLASRPGR